MQLPETASNFHTHLNLKHAVNAEPPFIITSLILVSKILNHHKSLQSIITHAEQFYIDEDEQFKDVEEKDEEGEEVFKDVEENEQNEEEGRQEVDPKQPEGRGEAESSDLNEEGPRLTKDKTQYDPFARDPLYAKAENTVLWEISMLAKHYHPTVRKFVEQIMENRSVISYPGNSLLDFTLANFLDRFSFKKAKKKESSGMKNLMQKHKLRMSKIEEALTFEQIYKQQSDQKLRVEEQFFMKYFDQKQKST